MVAVSMSNTDVLVNNSNLSDSRLFMHPCLCVGANSFAKNPSNENARVLLNSIKTFTNVHNGRSSDILFAAHLLFNLSHDKYSGLRILEIKARNNSDKEKLKDVASAYMDFADEYIRKKMNTQSREVSDSVDFLNLKIKISSDPQVVDCYKRAFFCAYDAQESELAISISKKMFATNTIVDMAELYYKAAKLCIKLYEDSLSKNDLSKNDKIQANDYFIFASVFFGSATDGDSFYVINARSEYDRLFNIKSAYAYSYL